ncbi:MAG: hypothetical protein HYW23_01200 [Candidatus Aenigmarchaeota archaeon]|nr:hypothetical protein [Candidatus Aenigmarchaeota archaeon]
MAFERYIYKHGKKLGPYYYENVRTPDGRVKTVYLGTNPHHHPKHRIRRPLFFVILILTLILIFGSILFLMQNKAYLTKRVRQQQPNFEVDQILLKILVRSSEFVEKQVRIMNTGAEPTTIQVEALGLLDIVKIDSSAFTLKSGQTKIVTVNFSSFVPEQSIEHQPGVYIGKLIVKSEKAVREIPIVVEIETKNVLFDMNLNPVAIERKVKQGTDTTIEVRLFNLESLESANVDVEYFVKDMNGNTITTETETVVVKTQASFFKTISIPKNLNPGPYVFAAVVKFGNSIGTASYLFEVVGPEEQAFTQFCRNSVMCMGLSLTTILLLFALMAYLYFFIGAYLYEKIAGIVTLPKKRKEEAAAEEEVIEEPEGIFESIKNKIKEWKEGREAKKAEEEESERKEELESLAVERKEEKIVLGSKLKKFYDVVDSLKEVITKDISKAKKLYLKAKKHYLELEEHEKKRVYHELTDLHNQLTEFIEKTEQKEGLKIQQEKKKLKDFFHKIGLYSTPEERRQAALQKEREKQEKLRKKEELRSRKELERKQKEPQKLAEEKKPSLFGRIFKKEKPEFKLEYKEKPVIEKKPGIFGGLLGRRQEEKQMPISEFDELEEAIRSLGLFKKVEKEGTIAQEKKPGILAKLFKKEKALPEAIAEKMPLGKGKNFESCSQSISDVKKALGMNDIPKARELYADARSLYLGLENKERKEIYNELMELYNRLLK